MPLIRLTDLLGNPLTDEATLMSHAVAQKVIVVHADNIAQSEHVVFLSRILGGDDNDTGDDPAACSSPSPTTPTFRPPPWGSVVPGSLILGNVADVQRLGIHAAADKWIRAHGDIVKVQFLGQDAFVVRRATFARQVLARQNKLAPPTHGRRITRALFAMGPAIPSCRDLNPCFYSKSIALLYEPVEDRK